jgi:hypothetical protein
MSRAGRKRSRSSSHQAILVTLLGWLFGAAFTVLLVYLDSETVHTASQIPVFLLSLPQVTLAAFTENLIRDPAHYSQLLFDALMVFWGGCVYGVFALLATTVLRGTRERGSSTEE